MRIVEEPDGGRGRKAASHLRKEIRHHLRVIAGLDGKGHGDRRIQMGVGAAEEVRGENSAEYGEGPRRRDHHPSAAFGFGALEKTSGNHAVPKQHHHEGPGELAEQRAAHHARPPAVDSAAGPKMYCFARAVKLFTWAAIHGSSRPSSSARRRATRGAMALVARAFRSRARVRRASASSSDRDISRRADHTISAAM